MLTAEIIHEKLIAGLRKFFLQSGRTSAVVGLSGGIDSALVAALAVEALGKQNVLGILMPSHYSTVHSVADAVQLAENLELAYHIVPIESIYHSYIKELAPVFEHRKTIDVTEENIQARIRGTLLMAVSNKFGNLVLNTSNKSELAMGYGTLYGDLVGALMVLGDVYKTQVYEVANLINRKKEIIPYNTIEKEPSAELRPNQKDSDSLPPYDQLDSVLNGLIEQGLSPEELIAQGLEGQVILQVQQKRQNIAFKSLQLPPMIKISEHPLLPSNKWV